MAPRSALGRLRPPPHPMAPERVRLGKIRQTERAARSLKESPPMRFCGLPRLSHLRPLRRCRQRWRGRSRRAKTKRGSSRAERSLFEPQGVLSGERKRQLLWKGAEADGVDLVLALVVEPGRDDL